MSPLERLPGQPVAPPLHDDPHDLGGFFRNRPRLPLHEPDALIEHVEGTTPMGPFQGMGITAFDNITGQFFNVWIDSMSTGVMLARGGRPEGDVQAMTGEYPNPATGTLTGFRSQMRLEGPDRRTYTMWESRGDGEAKTMEIHYTRAQD